MNRLSIYQFIVFGSFTQLPLCRKFFQNRCSWVRRRNGCAVVFRHKADRDCTRRAILWRRLEEDQAAIKTT